jgi:8-hydroxy-5-deazaflavin:NADPH oxidoreductase
MKVGVLGTGVVGESIASALVARDNFVMMGSRKANNDKTAAWVKKNSKYASAGTFGEAASFGDIIFICLSGEYALDVVKDINEENVRNKIIVDITNPLDFTKGMPPRILENLGNSTSLGEEIQNLLPDAYVVKALNTVNYKLMVDARLINNGDHNLFVCGNNLDAKNKVMHLLVDNFHWKADRLIDLGGIEMSRCVEAIVPFWVAVYQKLGTPLFNFKIVQ